jgi:predicted small lipoprotein YifL
MIKNCICVFAVLLALGSLGACGKKGMLGVPEGATYPQTYPRS